ncbi:hypothetical protein FY136_28580 (plasmid) [Agrobacterium tumefaciens]|uniref:hypothetical protein n=1 Tax=Agrobacterium tumefaciens TaxID=358 RepID=UPI0021D2B874|nr:hypothetical protein [Agrobacterium tumefaciens]UXT53220.1 hypothetical protein FY136_28580 [Agrobacterium tumefaciens]
MASLKQLRNHPRVEDVDDQRGRADEYVFVTLRRGWSIDPLRDSRSFSERTITEAMDSVRHFAMPFAGPYDD